jgi:hypothetical protein
MHRSNEKGTTVIHSEQPSKAPRASTGLFATLIALLGALRSGVLTLGDFSGVRPVLHRQPILSPAWVVMALVGFFLLPAAAFGSPLLSSQLTAAPLDAQQPGIRGTLFENRVFSTRAMQEAEVETFDTEAHWQAEYSTNTNGPWTAGGEGTLSGNGTGHISIGAPDETTGSGFGPEVFHVLHHLTPSTTYYARFTVEDPGGTASRTFEFKTLPVAKPEIARSHNEPEGYSTFQAGFLEIGGTSTSKPVRGQVETNGLKTEYAFEYAQAEGGPWTSFAAGTITVAEDFADLHAVASGLTPETTYFIRLRASNEKGSTEEMHEFTTKTDRPVVGEPTTRNITASSARFETFIDPNNSKTEWHYAYTTEPTNPSSWQPIAGMEGTISQAQAEALPAETGGDVQGYLTGLKPSSRYCVRVYASNEAGEGRNFQGKLPTNQELEFGCFTTEGPPTVKTEPDHALVGGAVRLLGSVNPEGGSTSAEQTITIGGAPTGGTYTLTYRGQTTGPISVEAAPQGSQSPHGSVERALEALSDPPQVSVTGFPGGPYTILFVSGEAGVNEPQMTADASGLTPSGTVTITPGQEGGEHYETKAYFEYVTQSQYEKAGFAEAQKTPEEAAATFEFLGQDISNVQAGQTYRYRLVASSTFPGAAVIQGATESLTAPTPVPKQEPAACPNASSRTGSSANLPDCRAYEQLTPIDKEGAQEAYNYGPKVSSGALIGEDGEHAVFEDAAVNWGTSPDSGQSPYFFSREEAHQGWTMRAGTPQPEFGAQQVEAQLYSTDLSEVALESGVHTSPGNGTSKDVELQAGPAGGPYAQVASVPRRQVEPGWVAASGDFSKLVLQVEDRELVTPRTKTKSGDDLYEYSNGHLSQVNVGVGTCGAKIVNGEELKGVRSSSHAVSADGSRVFFEAATGSNCSNPEPTHLYIREAGAKTIDIGAYSFMAASPDGGEVLVASETGEAVKYFIYRTETGTTKEIFAGAPGETIKVSQEFKAIYFISQGGEVDRYDVSTESSELALVVNLNNSGTGLEATTSPDGRLFYFHGGVPDVPGESQAFLYDSAEGSVHCLSCASSFDPEPKLAAYFPIEGQNLGPLQQRNGIPSITSISPNGDFAFFDTPAALVPGDVDGEVAPTPQTQVEFQSQEFSPSSDVYEWRKDGVDECEELQGCLALITNGRGGFLNLLLGISPSGRDVFIYTRSELLPQDNDNAGDIYDARIDGGFPGAPPGAVECEGDACSTPASAPNDPTPASETFTGPGDISQARKPVTPVKKAASKKKKKKRKGKKKRRRKQAKGSRAAKKSLGRSKR